MLYPNFLIIGANKGGTSSFYKYLDQHPEIFMSEIKEPMFFLFNEMNGTDTQASVSTEEPEWDRWKPVSNLEEYKKMFSPPPGTKAAGEASTAYLANPMCAERIYRFNPQMKLIAILRNPVSRAFSNYLMYVRLGHEDKSFAAVVGEELAGKRGHLPQGRHYLQLGYYYESLNTYIKTFGRENVKVYLIEELKEDPASLFRDAFEFLGVDPSFTPDVSTRFNVNENVTRRGPLANFLLRADNRIHFTKLLPSSVRRKLEGRLKLDPAMREKLAALYREDILKVQELTGKNLSAWLS